MEEVNKQEVQIPGKASPPLCCNVAQREKKKQKEEEGPQVCQLRSIYKQSDKGGRTIGKRWRQLIFPMMF